MHFCVFLVSCKKYYFSQNVSFPQPAMQSARSWSLLFVSFSSCIPHPAMWNAGCRNIFYEWSWSSHNLHPTIAECGMREVIFFMIFSACLRNPQPLMRIATTCFLFWTFHPATRKLWITGSSLIYDWVVCFRISQLWIAEKLVRL